MRDLELLTGHVIGVLTSSILLKTDTIEVLLEALLRGLASVKSSVISDVLAFNLDVLAALNVNIGLRP